MTISGFGSEESEDIRTDFNFGHREMPVLLLLLQYQK
jgi:hypothetical protein